MVWGLPEEAVGLDRGEQSGEIGISVTAQTIKYDLNKEEEEEAQKEEGRGKETNSVYVWMT